VDLGKIEDASAAADEVVRLNPNFTTTQFMRNHTLHDPIRDSRFRELMHKRRFARMKQTQSEVIVFAAAIFYRMTSEQLNKIT